MKKGHTLDIFSHKFYLEDADQYTKDFLASRGLAVE